MNREELSELISDVAADLSQTKEVWTAGDLADALLAAFDEAGVQCLRWELMDSAPLDESILAACKVRDNETSQSWWEMHSVCVHSETGEITSETDAGWSIDDYSHFMPLPPPPKENSNES